MSDALSSTEDAIITLLQLFGKESWLLDAQPTSDAAGVRLEVLVVSGEYPSADPLPRQIGGMYLIVRQVPDPLLTKEQARRVLNSLT